MHTLRTTRFVHAVPVWLPLFLLLCFLVLPAPTQQVHAQGQYSISTGITPNNQFDVVMFTITAKQSVRLYRFWNIFAYPGTGSVEIWARYGGLTRYDNTGWQLIGQASVTATNSTTITEIPADLDFLINPNETWGFAIYSSSLGSRYANGVPGNYIFSDNYLTVDVEGYGGSGTTNPGAGTANFDFQNYPRSFCGTIYYDEGRTGPNDAGIASIDSPPIPFCAGKYDVKVTLRNNGTNYLTSATVNWTINGAPQAAYNWSGSLDTLNNRETQLTLGSHNFLTNTPYTITAWTSMPNGVQDTVNNNDTASISGQAAIAGTFTIGGVNPDYPTFAAAVKDLNSYGLCGPVVFNVRSGTYKEQISIGDIDGASAVNTVTFQSESGNTPDVNLTYSASSSASNYVVEFNAAKYVTFRNMTIMAAGSSYGYVLHFPGGSEYITIENCELMGVNANSTSSYLYVVYSPGGDDSHITFRNCGIREGSRGMLFYGPGTTTPEQYNIVENCEFTGQYYYAAAMMYYQTEMDFIDNIIDFTTSSTSTRYGVYIYGGYNNNIERNSIFLPGGYVYAGLYLYDQGYYISGTTRVVNNFISLVNNSSVSYAALYNYWSTSYIAYNTVYSNSPISTTYYYGLVINRYSTGAEFLNNIYYHEGSRGNVFATYPSGSTYDPVTSDYNVFYSNHSPLAYWSGDRTDLAALQAVSGMDQNSIEKTVEFADVKIGDLHLAGASQDDADLTGLLLPTVTDDIDHNPRIVPYRGADEACYLLPGSLNYEFVDRSGLPAAYAEAPGAVGVKYSVTFPDFASTVTFTVQFYDPFTNALVYETSFSAPKKFGVPLQGTQYISLPPTLPPGAYRMEVIFHTMNSCGNYRDYMPYPSALLVVPEGRTPCVVWPGDANNDGVVNYSDRRDLNMYIYNANLRTSWLNGPKRYLVDQETNPFTYLEWKPQASSPWQTPEGCYMDTDGNGVINNLDYIAMKMNWSKMTPWFGGNPKSEPGTAAGFTLDQNYPNPFYPSTLIRCAVPEASSMHLVVTDALGRRVYEEQRDQMEQGMHEIPFDGSQLPSGTYIATMTMTSIASGATYTKTIKMALMR